MLEILYVKYQGEKQAAVVPADLVEFYNTKDLIGKVFSLNHFQIAYTDPTEYPRYQNHSLSRCDWVILVNSKTELTEIPLSMQSDFPAHPWISSIKGLCTDKSTKKMLIGTHNLLNDNDKYASNSLILPIRNQCISLFQYRYHRQGH